MNYRKPELKTYTSDDILEKFGAAQNQYTTTTFYTTSGNSTVNVDGYIRYAPSSGNYFAYSNDTTYAIMVGDVDIIPGNNAYQRGFVGFDITPLQGKTIVSVTLRLYQSSGYSGQPYTIGQLTVDHVNFGTTLDGDASADFNNYIQQNIGTLSTDESEGWKTLDVKAQVQADINAARTSSQYRLIFGNNRTNDNETDSTYFEDAEGNRGTVYKPELVVIYY